MSDFNKDNELDNYGVWVKKPPRTIESTSESTDDPFGNFDISTDLPDFSELDNNSETENMDETNMSESTTEEDILNNQEEEISLDEFITDGVFETGPDEDKIKEKEAQMSETSAEQPSEETEAEEEVSLDSFIDTSSFDEPEISETSVEEPVMDDSDDTLNIDLSFDDDSSPLAEQSVTIDTPDTTEEAVDDGTESIDLSEFGITEFSDSGETSSSEPAGTEEVSLDDFGVDFSSDTEQTAETTEETVNEESVIEEPSATEDVSLDDFGIDFSTDTASAEDAPAEPENTEVTEDDSMNIEVTEDKDENITIEEPSTFAKENDDDFNLDDILNSVEDEDGKTVTVGNQEEALVKEIADIPEESDPFAVTEPEIQSETIEEFTDTSAADSIDFDSLTQDIPDTFDEETASLTTDELSNIASSVVATQEGSESEEPANDDSSTNVANSILQDIVGQLASLKTEITSLKTDFETLKNNNAQMPDVAETTSEDTGFFSSTDGDDTIALSTDELANILNTSEITEGSTETESTVAEENLLGDMNTEMDVPEEEYDTDLTMDFNNDNLVEPELDELDAGQNEAVISDELPEDISIPKVEDLIVDSSSTDLMEESSEDMLNISDEAQEDLSGELPDLSALNESGIEEEITDDFIETEASPDKSFDDIFAPDPSIDEALTEDKLDYLENDSNSQLESEETTVSSKEFDSTADSTEETESTIPGDLKTEIKSVLSYMDQLLENLPEEKIAEFAQSEQFETYKKLFKELGLS